MYDTEGAHGTRHDLQAAAVQCSSHPLEILYPCEVRPFHNMFTCFGKRDRDVV